MLNGGNQSIAHGVSGDGSVVVGYAENGNAADRIEAFRWDTITDTLTGLGVLNGGSSSIAYGVSGDGSVVVGWARNGAAGNRYEAFIWDQQNGTRSIQDVLTDDYGLVLNEWRLTLARGISNDGLTICGFGDNPDGNTSSCSRIAFLKRSRAIFFVSTARFFGVRSFFQAISTFKSSSHPSDARLRAHQSSTAV